MLSLAVSVPECDSFEVVMGFLLRIGLDSTFDFIEAILAFFSTGNSGASDGSSRFLFDIVVNANSNLVTSYEMLPVISCGLP